MSWASKKPAVRVYCKSLADFLQSSTWNDLIAKTLAYLTDLIQPLKKFGCAEVLWNAALQWDRVYDKYVYRRFLIEGLPKSPWYCYFSFLVHIRAVQSTIWRHKQGHYQYSMLFRKTSMPSQQGKYGNPPWKVTKGKMNPEGTIQNFIDSSFSFTNIQNKTHDHFCLCSQRRQSVMNPIAASAQPSTMH